MIARRTLAALLAAALLSGCAVRSDLMSPTGESGAALRPAPNEALVVFLRPTMLGYAIQAVVYDGEQFIGVVSRHTAVAYHTTPGPHRFVVVSEAADFLDAELGEGRTYFVDVVPRMGAWRARFSLRPLSASAHARDISTWLAASKVVTPNEAGRRWAERNQASSVQKKTAYEPKWLGKAERPVLRLDDGSPPVRE